MLNQMNCHPSPSPELMERESFPTRLRRLPLHRWSLVIGNLLEHFDSSLYGFLAPVLGEVFFPQFSPLYQLILAYSVYLVTFVARPFGGLFFSKLTYSQGPLKPLVWSLVGVALATGFMGLLPSAYQIGVFAPCLLVFVRFFQSFCAAGESAIAGYYLIEKEDVTKQISWSGLYQSSTMIGILIASSVSSMILLSPSAQDLWRYPFIAGFILGAWAVWMRLSAPEDPPETFASISYKETFKRLMTYPHLVAGLIPVYGFSYVVYSIPFVFLNPFLTKTTSLPLSALLQQTTTLVWVDGLLIAVAALVIQYFQWIKSLLGALLLFVLGASILFTSLPHLSLVSIFLLRFILVIGGIVFCTALIPWTAKLYPASDKYLLHSVGYNFGSEIFGRSTPAICFWIYALTEHPSSPLLYILMIAGFSFTLILFLEFRWRAQERVLVRV